MQHNFTTFEFLVLIEQLIFPLCQWGCVIDGSEKKTMVYNALGSELKMKNLEVKVLSF